MLSSILLYSALISGPAPQVLDGITERERLYREAEEKENEYLSGDGDDADYVPAEKSKINSQFESGTSAKKLDAPKTEAKQAPEKSQKVVSEFSYMRRLRNAYACMKDFVVDMYKARFQHDSEIVQCASVGSKACETSAIENKNADSKTVGDKFQICMDRP